MNPAALALCLLALLTPSDDPPKPFELRDGDRIVLLGNTFIERDQSYGYLETLLTAANPEKNLTFRNLGWSGDTVAGIARAGFGTPAEGFQHLKDHVLALKPTVLLISYGMNESFEGEAGLPKFVEGLNTLLDTLAPTKARVVLISPIAHEDLGRPLPDPARHNADLAKYAAAVAGVAKARDARFVDLYTPTLKSMEDQRRARLDLDAKLDRSRGLAQSAASRGLASVRGALESLTTDGIHLTPYGYWTAALMILESLGKPAAGSLFTSELPITPGGRVEARDPVLSWPLPPGPAAELMPKTELITLLIPKLPKGSYTLSIDGKPAKTASAEEWAEGRSLSRPADSARVEALRQVINAKNELYFHRWRPQNETYLFLFRKHEQGNNAVEIPLFDPLVEAKEKEIAKLRVPATHTYELKREGEDR